MRPIPRQDRIHPFEVVLQASSTRESQVLHTAYDANRATLAFEAALLRLTEQPITGELLLVQHDEETRTLLRQPLR